MNKLLLLPVLGLFGSLSAQAAYIQGGILDESRGVVQLTVSYGGCTECWPVLRPGLSRCRMLACACRRVS